MSKPEWGMDINRALEISGQVANKLREGKQARFIEESALAIDTIRNVATWAMPFIQRRIKKKSRCKLTGSMAREEVDLLEIAKKMRMPWYQKDRGYIVIKEEGRRLRIPKTCVTAFRKSSAWGLVFRSYKKGGTIDEIVSRAKNQLAMVRRVRLEEK